MSCNCLDQEIAKLKHRNMSIEDARFENINTDFFKKELITGQPVHYTYRAYDPETQMNLLCMGKTSIIHRFCPFCGRKYEQNSREK